METYISAMPLWAIALFVPTFIYSITFIANPAKQAALNAGMPLSAARNIQLGIVGFYILYLAYVSIFSLKGIFAINTLPPRIFVLATLPLAIILFVIVGNTGLFKKLLRSVTLESLIRLHTFRILGVFFIILYFYHLLPAGMAFAAGLGDILTAVLAIPVANRVAKKKPGSITAVYAWNILGMLDIVNVLVIAVVNAMKSMNNPGPGEFEMTIFPFVWFPAFAPATILFLHIAVFRKLAPAFSTRPPYPVSR
jgi:hypothetical protein